MEVMGVPRFVLSLGLAALATTMAVAAQAQSDELPGTGFEICTVAASCQSGPFGGELGGEIPGPAAVAADGAGNVYAVDLFNRVQKFDSSGNWERAWGKDVIAGGGTGFEVCTVAASCTRGEIGQLGGELTSPTGIAVDGAGDVYVIEVVGNRVEKFDSSGNWERAWGKDVVAGGGTGFEICTVATDCKWGAAGQLGGEFNFTKPYEVHGIDVAADSAGNVYVADQQNNRIQKFDSSGNFLRAWGRDVVAGGGTEFEACTVAANCKAGATGQLGGELYSPTAVAADSAGNVYVADNRNNRIQKYDSAGNWERAWGEDVVADASSGFEICTVAVSCQGALAGDGAGELGSSTGIAADPSGNVYVAEGFNRNRIQKFDSSGNWERAWGKDVIPHELGPSPAFTGFEICTTFFCQGGSSGGLGGELSNPNGVAVDSGGKVFVADDFNNRIQKYDSAGNWERAWGKDVVAPPPSPPTVPNPTCQGVQAGIVGTGGADQIRGTPYADVIVGLGGNDKLSGLGGNDVICGGDGKDALKGGTGDDQLYGEAGKDTLKGGPGTDQLKGGTGKDKQVQ
jgi:tripartite motif-containing protein 71